MGSNQGWKSAIAIREGERKGSEEGLGTRANELNSFNLSTNLAIPKGASEAASRRP
jgi:hypothetical protein